MIHIFHSLLMQCFPLSIFIFPGKSNSANDNYDSGCHSQLEVDKPWKNPASQHPGKVSLRVSIAAAPWLFLVTFPRGKTLLLPPTWIFRRPVFRFDFFPAFLDHIASNVGACCVFSRSIFPPSSSSFFLLWQEGGANWRWQLTPPWIFPGGSFDYLCSYFRFWWRLSPHFCRFAPNFWKHNNKMLKFFNWDDKTFWKNLIPNFFSVTQLSFLKQNKT